MPTQKLRQFSGKTTRCMYLDDDTPSTCLKLRACRNIISPLPFVRHGKNSTLSFVLSPPTKAIIASIASSYSTPGNSFPTTKSLRTDANWTINWKDDTEFTLTMKWQG